MAIVHWNLCITSAIHCLLSERYSSQTEALAKNERIAKLEYGALFPAAAYASR